MRNGIRFLPVEHEGNERSLSRRWKRSEIARLAVPYEDVIVVAPHESAGPVPEAEAAGRGLRRDRLTSSRARRRRVVFYSMGSLARRTFRRRPTSCSRGTASRRDLARAAVSRVSGLLTAALTNCQTVEQMRLATARQPFRFPTTLR